MQVLLRKLKGEDASNYLAVLVSMELSLHSLEVVSRLTSSLDLPQDFVNHYIANCIASCDRAEVRHFLGPMHSDLAVMIGGNRGVLRPQKGLRGNRVAGALLAPLVVLPHANSESLSPRVRRTR